MTGVDDRVRCPLRRILCLAVTVAGTANCFSEVAANDGPAIARLIDAALARRCQADQIVAAPTADDCEFLRRIHLDLVGRPPAPDVVRTFLADSAGDKRSRLILALLRDPRHDEHFAKTWRALLLPEADSDPQLRFFQPGLEAWLAERSRADVGFDRIVHDLLSVPIAGPTSPPQMVLRDLKQPNPIAFLASKKGDPATIAASATRLFLGVRLECAQCHNHPFDTWTQQQFWNQAAFLAGIQRRGRSPFSPLVEDPTRRDIAIMDTEATVGALFLTGETPSWEEKDAPRLVWARWMTSRQNSQFSQAIVNRIWCHLMGAGFVEPVDDFGANNPASHPELLAELSRTFVDSGFSLRTLTAGICLTDAYQRTSRTTDPSQTAEQQFARMAIKPMTGDQFFATVAQAIDYTPQTQRLGAGRDDDPVRRRILAEFNSAGLYADPETSVSQVLTLRNGTLIHEAVVRLTQRDLNATPAEALVESLYLKTLARMPSAEERDVIAAHLNQGDSSERPRRLGDVLWSLLNSAEFRWNH